MMLYACGSENEQVNMPTKYSIAQFYKNVNVSGGSFNKDATKLLASSNRTGIYNAISIPVNGGQPQQLTNSDGDAIFASSAFHSQSPAQA